tara:strand:+ start:1587 stop:3101 length:1515 start_codon:yes stop_codon:yes gene_type:complete
MTSQQANLITGFTQEKGHIDHVIVQFLVVYATVNVLKGLLGVLSSQMRPLFVKYCRSELILLIENGCDRGCSHIKPAEILQKLMSIPWDLYDIVHHMTTTFIPDCIILITTTISIASINKNIGMVSLVSIITTSMISYLHMNKFDFKEHEHRELELFTTYDERIHALFDIFAQNNFDFEKIKIQKTENDFFSSNKKELLLKTKTIGSTKVIVFVFFFMSFGIFSRCHSTYTNTEKATLIASLLQFSLNLTTFADNILSSHSMYYDVTLIDNFMQKFQIKTKTGQKNTGIFDGAITFDEVSFGYETHKVLTNFSCKLHKGQINCIIGRSGIGKSTIVHMISGFNDSYSGTIKIDGIDISDLSLHYTRENISICGQNAFIQNATIRENLVYGHSCQCASEKVQLETIHGTLSKYNLVKYFDVFDKKYNTVISATSLSGGQKQMINFCRILIRDTTIMIFDEPTSALNSQLSIQCLHILEQLSKRKTVILITHNSQFHKDEYNIVHV